MVTQQVEHCHWKNIEGKNCKDSRLVQGSHFCYRHYWQALWSSNELANAPLPTKPNWITLSFLIFCIALFFLGYMREPNWVLPQWFHTLDTVIQNPYLVQENPSLISFILGWFGTGGQIIATAWLLNLIVCTIPLRPRIRRLNIIVTLIFCGIFTFLILVALIISLVIQDVIQPAWIISIALIVIIFQFCFLIFRTSDTLNPSLITKYGSASYATLIFSSSGFSLFWILTGDWNNAALLIMRLVVAGINIYSGYSLLTYHGRHGLAIGLVNHAAELADALRPLDAYLLGFKVQSPTARSQALQRALAFYSNLSPLEQAELEEYILVKKKPSLWQSILGILAIIISAFLLEAPAQLLFTWVACEFFKLGLPLCLP